MMPQTTHHSKNTRGGRLPITPSLQQHLNYILPLRLHPMPVPADIPDAFYTMVDDKIHPLSKENQYKIEFLFFVKALRGDFLTASKETIHQVKKALEADVDTLMSNPYFQAIIQAKKQKIAPVLAGHILSIAQKTMEQPRYLAKNLATLPPFSLDHLPSINARRMPLSIQSPSDDTNNLNNLAEINDSIPNDCQSGNDSQIENTSQEAFKGANLTIMIPFYDFEAEEDACTDNLLIEDIQDTKKTQAPQASEACDEKEETNLVKRSLTDSTVEDYRPTIPYFATLFSFPCTKKIKNLSSNDLNDRSEQTNDLTFDKIQSSMP